MEVIQREMAAEDYDCMVSLLAAATNSYRKASTLNPFPKAFLSGGKDRDYDRLSDCLKSLPDPSDLFPPDATCLALQPDQQALLGFIGSDLVRLKRVDPSEVRQHFISCAPSLHPNCVFEVLHDVNSGSYQEFHALKSQHGSQIAFHGSSLENWHCIVNTGLRNFSNTDKQRTGAIFGEGIYLSTLLSVAVDFSRSGEGWSRSTILGPRLRVTGLCEVVKHPEQVKRQVPDEDQKGGTLASVPDAYIVVESSACVRVRHLLVYTETPARRRSSAPPPPGRVHHFILLYVALLAAIVMSREENRAQVRYMLRRISRAAIRRRA